MPPNSATSITIARIELALALLVACTRGKPPPAVDASPSAAAIASAPASTAPAELACESDADCVAVPSACCGAWPSNALHIAQVRKAVAESDAKRDCKKEKCASQVTHAACNQGRCVVW